MGNGTRHLLGAIAGIVAIPVVLILAFGGLSLTLRAYSRFDTGQIYAATGILAVGALVLALLVGTRISPLASLIPGLAFTAAGVLGVVSFRLMSEIGSRLGSSSVEIGPIRYSLAQAATDPVASGGYVLVGVLLLFASLPPSRWRGKPAAVLPGAHRVDTTPVSDDPWPPPPPLPSDPAQQRATPPLPGEETARDHPYAGEQQAPYPPASPFPSSSGPQAPYTPGSGPQAPYTSSSGPQAPYSGAEPESPYASSGAPYPAPTPSPNPRAKPPGYRPGERPSSWSGPQPPYNPESTRPAGDDPYAAPPSAFSRPAEPWGPPPETGQSPPTRAFSAESDEAAQADPTPRTMPDANANNETYRIPWTESDQARLRDNPDR